MIKRILVPTDGSEFASKGVRYAVALAKKLDATVCGLHVVDVKLLEGPFLRDLSASLGTAPYVNYQGNIAMILEERGKAALSSVEKACQEAGVRFKTNQVTGIVARSIVEQAELADLIVLGRGGEHGPWLEGLIGSTAEAVVRRASQPVLITGTETLGDQQIVAAFDGSAHSRHALRVGVALAMEWKAPLRVLVVGGDETQAIVEEAQSFLESYDVESDLQVRRGDPSEVIVSYAAEIAADLLVMGAYGHSKVRELVVGSTTTYAINHAPCPVLLARKG
jgi:nucleotide-binding universal stress UspA family protein